MSRRLLYKKTSDSFLSARWHHHALDFTVARAVGDVDADTHIDTGWGRPRPIRGETIRASVRKAHWIATAKSIDFQTAAYGQIYFYTAGMACLPKTEFKFVHRLPGCNFRLTIKQHAESPSSLQLLLSGELQEGGDHRPFNSGLLLAANVDGEVDEHVEKIMRDVNLLAPTPLSEECKQLLRASLGEWLAASGG